MAKFLQKRLCSSPDQPLFRLFEGASLPYWLNIWQFGARKPNESLLPLIRTVTPANHPFWLFLPQITKQELPNSTVSSSRND